MIRGWSELALSADLVQVLQLDYIGTVSLSSATSNNVPTSLHGSVLIYWEGLVVEANVFSIPSLVTPLLVFRPDFNWVHDGIIQEKIEYFKRTHGVKICIKNEGGCKMILVVYAIRHDVNIDQVAKTISHFAPSLTPISPE